MKISEIYSFKEEDKRGDYKFDKSRKGELTNRGYIRHEYLCDDGKKHRILEHVAKWGYFNGDIPDGMEIDHINGDRADNRLSNLRVLTHKDNCNTDVTLARYSGRIETEEQKAKISAAMKNRLDLSKPVIQVNGDGSTTRYESLNECARCGYSFRHVCNACHGKNYSKGHEFKGSFWYYEDEYLTK